MSNNFRNFEINIYEDLILVSISDRGRLNSLYLCWYLLYPCITVILYPFISVSQFPCIIVSLYPWARITLDIPLYYLILSYPCIFPLSLSLDPCIPVSFCHCIPESLYPCILVSLHPCITVSLYLCILYPCVTASLYHCILVFLYPVSFCHCIPVSLFFCLTMIKLIFIWIKWELIQDLKHLKTFSIFLVLPFLLVRTSFNHISANFEKS